MNLYGVKGYPTPPDLPTATHCRTFRIPDSTAWLAVFMGALWHLANERNWQQISDTDMTTADAAAVALNVIWDAYAQDEGICPVLEAPYWDDLTADDADDEYPEGVTQPWYGELVPVPEPMTMARSRALLESEPEFTWQENASIWLISSFLAVTGEKKAAIAFRPIAKRFILAFRAHDIGGIVRVFIDAAEVGRKDTYSADPKVANFTVMMPDDDDDHTVWVEMAEEQNPAVEGDAQIQVIRKRLDASEVYPRNIRYNPTTDTVQQTYDDGVTWVDNPAVDPRYNPAYQFPPVSSDDPQCQAAANEVRFINNVIDETLANIDLGLDLLGIATTILPLFVELGPFALLFDLVLAFGSAVLSAGADAVAEAFTNDVYDQLTCIFFCNIETNGTVTEDDLADIQADIASDIGGLVQIILEPVFFLMGNVGLSNAGTKGDAPADCSECECLCTFVWDFTVSDGGWFDLNCYGSPYTAWDYVGGQGWHQTGTPSQACIKSPDVPVGTRIVQMKVTVTNVGATNLNLSYGAQFGAYVATTGTGTFTLNGDDIVTSMNNFLQVGVSHGGADEIYVSRVEVKWDNCP